MFPPSPQDWLPEEDLVDFLLDTVTALDLSILLRLLRTETSAVSLHTTRV